MCALACRLFSNSREFFRRKIVMYMGSLAQAFQVPSGIVSGYRLPSVLSSLLVRCHLRGALGRSAQGGVRRTVAPVQYCKAIVQLHLVHSRTISRSKSCQRNLQLADTRFHGFLDQHSLGNGSPREMSYEFCRTCQDCLE